MRVYQNWESFHVDTIQKSRVSKFLVSTWTTLAEYSLSIEQFSGFKNTAADVLNRVQLSAPLSKPFNWRPGDLTVRQGMFAGQRIFRWNLCSGTELGRRRCNTKIYSLLYVSLQVDRWNIFFMTIIGPKNNNWKLCIPNFPRVCNKTFCGGPWTTYKQSFWSL